MNVQGVWRLSLWKRETGRSMVTSALLETPHPKQLAPPAVPTSEFHRPFRASREFYRCLLNILGTKWFSRSCLVRTRGLSKRTLAEKKNKSIIKQKRLRHKHFHKKNKKHKKKITSNNSNINILTKKSQVLKTSGQNRISTTNQNQRRAD